MPSLPTNFSSKIHLTGLSGAASALVIAEICAKSAEPALIICKDDHEAQEFYEDLQLFFRFYKYDREVHLLTPWENSPYRRLPASVSARLNRLRSLYATKNKNNTAPVIVCSNTALLQRTIHPSFLNKSFELGKGSSKDPRDLEHELIALGYVRDDTTEDPGTFSMRGGIVDIYSPLYQHPCRLEFDDIEIESLRFFNSETQRSLDDGSASDTLNVIPVREFDCSQANLHRAREALRGWADENDFPRSSRDRILELLQRGVVTQELDYLLPFLQEEPAFCLDYFKDFTCFSIDEIQQKSTVADFFAHEKKLAATCEEEKYLVPSMDLLFSDSSAIFSDSAFIKKVFIDSLTLSNFSGPPNIQFLSEPGKILHSAEKKKGGKSINVDALAKETKRRVDEGNSVLFIANAQSQLDRMAILLSQRQIKTKAIEYADEMQKDGRLRVHLLLGSISHGFTLREKQITIISEDEIFGKKTHARKTTQKNTALQLRYLDELQPDDLVVHAEHGIGRYKGLVKLSPGGIQGDFVHLEYAENDKLYLPVYRLELLQKYVGAPGGRAALDRLGNQQFLRVKERVKAAVKDIAGRLLKVHAERAMKSGYAFSSPDEQFREFEAEFPYDETPDQQKAIQDTLDDMCEAKPMDRLVCGDVGFGKTEVAVRAAFKAVQDGKQVAVLVPTTILAEQHYQTFSARLKNHAVKVASISRFKVRSEQLKTIADLSAGNLDVIIGTHRLLSKDVKFRDLGLLIVDEEQRFGVEHKEKLKELRATTDLLTLTATPIPRTLHLALMGLRDISLIQTPPADRLSIKTHLATFDISLIRQAVEAELARGGQIFFIHNRVQTIEQISKLLQEHMPKLRIGVAHGQMNETQLEKVMLGFYRREYDMLLATTIIENGLDVPNANTIIVNRADAFGLSQLYQIRGRVGRSQTRAFAYFLIPEGATISGDARERLSILQRFVELGSGYAVASHDLELRGGGDILGGAQSGHIADVGYDMYLEMLEAEVRRLKGEEVSAPKEDVEINSPFPALLPDSFIPDTRSRLAIYRRLASLDSEEAVSDAKKELLDRYGKLPWETEELLSLLVLKLLLRRMGFKAIHIGKTAISIVAGIDPKISMDKLLSIVAQQSNRFSLSPDGKLIVRGEFLCLKQVYDGVRSVIALISDST